MNNNELPDGLIFNIKELTEVRFNQGVLKEMFETTFPDEFKGDFALMKEGLDACLKLKKQTNSKEYMKLLDNFTKFFKEVVQLKWDYDAFSSPVLSVYTLPLNKLNQTQWSIDRIVNDNKEKLQNVYSKLLDNKTFEGLVSIIGVENTTELIRELELSIGELNFFKNKIDESREYSELIKDNYFLIHKKAVKDPVIMDLGLKLQKEQEEEVSPNSVDFTLKNVFSRIDILNTELSKNNLTSELSELIDNKEISELRRGILLNEFIGKVNSLEQKVRDTYSNILKDNPKILELKNKNDLQNIELEL